MGRREDLRAMARSQGRTNYSKLGIGELEKLLGVRSEQIIPVAGWYAAQGIANGLPAEEGTAEDAAGPGAITAPETEVSAPSAETTQVLPDITMVPARQHLTRTALERAALKRSRRASRKARKAAEMRRIEAEKLVRARANREARATKGRAA